MTQAKEELNAAMYYRPSLRNRFWRALGFGKSFIPDDPPGMERMPGWAKSNITISISFLDRLRLVLVGRCEVGVTIWADKPVEKVVTTASFRIPQPFGDKL